jgi:uncharacterized protein VirK/YbjX
VIRWAWRTSAQIDQNWRLRAKFVLAALGHQSIAGKLERPCPPMEGLLAEWPDTVGFLLWPYQCCDWDAETRFTRIESHLDAVEKIPGLNLAPDDKLVLADLSSISPDISLVLDRSKWLSREGHLTLSLFKGEFRAFTVAFSLFNYPETELFIGGIQGRQDANILSLYRDLTKDFHGIRPRDFILEALRLLAVNIKAQHIHAVADGHKISRHKYFGKKGAPGLFYDEVWKERGGLKAADSYFELPLGGARRNIEEIPAKKRSMYRRRYEMLDAIASMIPNDLGQAERRRFDAS